MIKKGKIIALFLAGMMTFASAFTLQNVYAEDNSTQVKTSTENSDKNIIATVKSKTLNMRKNPTVKSSIVKKLGKNDKVEVLYLTSKNTTTFKNAWAKVTTDGETGYVNSKYLCIPNISSDKIDFAVLKSKITQFKSQLKKVYSLLKNYLDEDIKNVNQIVNYNVTKDKLTITIQNKGTNIDIINKQLKTCLQMLLPNYSDYIYSQIEKIEEGYLKDKNVRYLIDGQEVTVCKNADTITITVENK